ncbi:dentin sialophosphoprotein [Drosophila rhopaloa]|uniref:Uncharacterized protein n=1 Tax=Drosophila rhopaloa TaxID=1041015 RepID=A0ABM5HZK4_DRORH|nr:dentin sialophosphoprotein [Drosophila rhopaloa]
MNSETNKLPDNWMFYADVVAKTEFKLYNIMPGINFQNRIQYHCHKRKIAGYIIYSPDGQRAIGVMEGFQKNINRIKDWILRRCIPEPFHHRVIFSSYEMSFNPNKELFHEKYTVPKGATFLGDLYESYFDECELESEEESQEEEDEDPIESLGEYAGFFTENSGLDCDDTTSDTTMTTESLNNDYDGDEDTTTETTTTDDDTTIETTEPDEDSTTETTEPHYETSTESTEPHYATSTESTDHHYEATTESTEPDDETTTEPTSSDDDSSYTFLAV